jgi:type IV pilus biogenesis protein PilP
MRNKSKLAALLAAWVACGSALADAVSDQLTRLEAETLVLKAREKQLEVQAGIIAKQNDIMAKQALNDRLTQAAVIGDPVIRSIEGVGSALYATLQLADGSVVDAQAGDVLSNGMRVISIKPKEVIVENKKKRRVRLAGMSHSPAQFNPGYPGTGLALPPPLPMAGLGKAPK